MVRWTGIVLYYTWVFFLFLALLIYAASQASSFNSFKCLGKSKPTEVLETPTVTTGNRTLSDTEDWDRYLADNTTDTGTDTGTNTGTDASNQTTPAVNMTATCDQAKGEANIGPIVQVMMILYGVEMGIVAVIWLFLFRLSNLEVTKFTSPGCFNRCMGCLSKLLPFVIVMAHYVICVLIAILIIVLFFLRSCLYSCKSGDSSYSTVMKNGSMFAIVAAIAWCLMHFIAGGCYRRNVTFDAYFYTPAVQNKCCRYCLINVGP